MRLDIRLLRPSEGAVLLRVAEELFDDPLNIESTRRFLADPSHHLSVAVRDGIVVGFASAVHYVHPDKPRPEMWINEVSVAPSARRRGVAKEILAALLDKARELGCAEAWVLTDRDNAAALRLYESAGGERAPEGVVMFNFLLTAPRSPTRALQKPAARDETG